VPKIERMWVKRDGIALCAIPKNGSTSFINALRSSKFLTQEELLLCDKRVAFFRDPVTRWSSAYSFFHYLNENDYNGQIKKIPKSVTHNGYEAWVDFALEVALSEEPNMHWCRQTDITGGFETHAYRFDWENIQKHWGKHWPGKLPGWENALTSHLPTTDYRAGEIADYYAADYAKFKSIAVI